MLALLASAATALSVRREIDAPNRVVALPDYGFHSGGAFSFRLMGSNLTGIAILLAPFLNVTRFTFTDAFSAAFCRDPASAPGGYLSEFQPGPVRQWGGTVGALGIYVPLVVNCHAQAFAVDMAARNPDSYLDARESFLPYMYAALCLVNLALALALMVNAVCHWRLRIGSHSALAVGLCLRALAQYLCARIWAARIVTETVPGGFTFVVGMAEVLALSVYFTVNGLIVAGWGTYRETIGQSDWLPILNVSWVFFLVKWLTSLDYQSPFLLVIGGVMGMWYIEFISEWVEVPARLLREEHPLDAPARAKLELALRFGREYAKLLLCGVGLAGVELMAWLWAPVASLAEEVLHFAITCVGLRHLWIRAEHEGTQFADVEIEDGTDVKIIEEPDQEPALAFVARAGADAFVEL
jgi:hypothetical protein